MHFHRSNRIRVLMLALALVFLCACGKTAAPGGSVTETDAEQRTDKTIFAMDTVMDLSPFGENSAAAAEAAAERIQQLEQLFSVTIETSDIAKVNAAGGKAVEVSEDTTALLQTALEFCEKTDGALDLSIYPVLKTWGFTTGEYQVPSEDVIRSLLENVDYQQIQLSGSSVQIAEGMEIDLGSVAKGYTGDQVMEVFRENGLTSGMISLGGNVQVLGSKPDGSDWRIAIQDPEGGEGFVGVVEVSDKAVITSGGYERFFEEDGVTYWHIIDPATGAPARSGVISATIVGESGTMCDALSTAFFIMGPDRAAEFWRTYGGFDYLLVMEDGSLIYSEGLQDCFTPMEPWSNNSITVVSK